MTIKARAVVSGQIGRAVSALAVLLVAIAASGGEAGSPTSEAKISRPGHYSGYSPVLFNGYKKISFYVPVRDGTRLAVDLFRPTRNGVEAREKLPVVWMHDPYNRSVVKGKPAAELYPGFAAELVKFGYNVAVVDFRGLYASFGTNKVFNFGEFVPPATLDAYDMTEWFAKQPWSNGRVGMWGCSATGGSQMQAATTRPPSLKAIFPMSAGFDEYAFLVIGGIPLPPFAPAAEVNRDANAVPVDGPQGIRELAEAIAQHKSNIDLANVAVGGSVPFRDSVASELGGMRWWVDSSPSTHLDALQKSDVGIYTTSNWDESGTKVAAFTIFGNLPPKRVKLLAGPGQHCGWQQTQEDTGFSIVTEELRFFDYWLKGVQNGVMDEAPVTYFTYNAPPDIAWRSSPTWPLSNEVRTEFYLGEGVLNVAPPQALAHDEISMGPFPEANPIHVSSPSGGIFYQTLPLDRDVEVTGYPVMRLWVSTAAADTDAFAQLDDVAPSGEIRSYQMFGRLRASARALATPPYNNFGLPWHTFRAADARPLERDQPTELDFEMLPMSYRFLAGHRIRLHIAFSNPSGGIGATVHVLRSPRNASVLTLPIIPVE